MKSVLIIQTAFLGDVILATPVISEMKRIYPDCSIDILVRKGNESLLDNNPHVGRILLLDKKNGKYRSLTQLLKIIRNNHYDEIINLHRYGSTGFLTAFSGAKYTVGYDKNPFSIFFSKRIKHSLENGQHEVERNLLCIAHHGAASFRRPEMYPSEADYEKTHALSTDRYYCLAPASVWFTKQLPVFKWIELGKKLSRQGKVFLIGGPSDWELCDQIQKEIDSKACENIAGTLSFLESAALIRNATRNYVNDSGPMHICSAMNAPVTAFFCSTIPGFGFGPLSEDSEIRETLEPLDCKPCGIHGYRSCPRGHFKCGTTIELVAKS